MIDYSAQPAILALHFSKCSSSSFDALLQGVFFLAMLNQ